MGGKPPLRHNEELDAFEARINDARARAGLAQLSDFEQRLLRVGYPEMGIFWDAEVRGEWFSRPQLRATRGHPTTAIGLAEEAMKKGDFREDLYYRLNVISVHLPRLRDRREDIPLLIDYFLKKYSKENQKSISDISKEARALLLRYPFPGNVRELENLIERAVVLCREEMITTLDFPFHLRDEKSEREWKFSEKEKSLPESLEEVERDLIIKALHQHHGIQTKAADSLGISERVLRYKMKKYRIRPGEVKE